MRRHVEKVAGLEKARTFGSGRFPEQMRLARARVAQKDKIRSTGEVRRDEALHLPPCQGLRLSDERFGSCREVRGLKTRGWRWLPVLVKRDVPQGNRMLLAILKLRPEL